MADTLTVRLLMDVIRKNIVAAEGREISDHDLMAFVAEAGFVEVSAERWVCEEVSLDTLTPDEYTDVRLAD